MYLKKRINPGGLSTGVFFSGRRRHRPLQMPIHRFRDCRGRRPRRSVADEQCSPLRILTHIARILYPYFTKPFQAGDLSPPAISLEMSCVRRLDSPAFAGPSGRNRHSRRAYSVFLPADLLQIFQKLPDNLQSFFSM